MHQIANALVNAGLANPPGPSRRERKRKRAVLRRKRAKLVALLVRAERTGARTVELRAQVKRCNRALRGL